METEKKRGRKPIEDPKVCIRLYINKSLVDINGGEEELKGFLMQRTLNRAKCLKPKK